MDAKITKKRLSENLQYDWIKIIIFVVIAIVVWELLFTTTSVRVKTGQNFKVYYYSSISSTTTDKMYEILNEEDVLSYDILEKNIEVLTSKYESTVLSARMSTGEGDIMIIDNLLTASTVEAKKEDKRCSSSNFKNIADGYNLYDFDLLLHDAIDYLENFKENGEISDEKVEAVFRTRMKKDNRYRSEKNILNGIKQEKQRIVNLQKEVNAFNYLLENYKDTDLFVNYVKYEYSYFNELSESKYEEEKELNTLSCAGSNNTETENTYEEIYKNNKEAGAKKFALNTAYLTNGEKEITNLFKIATSESDITAENVYLTVFNFREKQPDLGFEAISVINQIVREYSNLFSLYKA